MLANNTRMPVATLAAALIVGAMVALWMALMPAPAQAQTGDVLHLQSIKCVQITGDDWYDSTDEPYINVDGTEVWSGRNDPLRMKDGQVQNLAGVSATLSGQSARVQLWEFDGGAIAPSDGPAEFFADYTGGDERTRTLTLNGGVYEITYRVERPTETVAPETVIDSGPSGPTADNTPTFTFSGSDNVTPPSGLLYSYKVDNGEWSPFQAATSATTSVLTDGDHTFFVKSKDAAGNEDATPAQRSFAVDTVNPRVMSTVPASNATRIAPGADVSATFSEAMMGSSLNPTTFKLFRAGTTTAIGAVVSYESTTNRAILNPNANLRLGTKYKAVVTTGAKDLVGNQLDQNSSLSGLQQKTWTFTIRN
jgi:Bacterial Ig-like domain